MTSTITDKEMNQRKQNLRQSRSNITRLCTKTSSLVQDTVLDVPTMEQTRSQLETELAELKKNASLFMVCITVEADKDAEDDKTWDYTEKGNAAIVSLTQAIKGSLTSSGAASGNIQSSRKGTKLPEITLAKFNGNYSDYQSWLDQFNALIGDQPDIPNINKLQYLRQSLEGPAATAVESFAAEASSYQPVLDHLAMEFGKKRMIIESIFKKIHDRPAPTNQNLREFGHFITTATGALRSNGLRMSDESMSYMFIAHLQDKLPFKIRNLWKIHVATEERMLAPNKLALIKGTTDLDGFLSFLRLHASVQEDNASEKSRTKENPKKKEEEKKKKEPVSTATSLMANANPGKSNPTPKKKTGNTCLFCKGGHQSSACGTVGSLPLAKRWDRVRNRTCYRCLGSETGDHSANDCPLGKCPVGTACTTSGKHHQFLCSQWTQNQSN